MAQDYQGHILGDELEAIPEKIKLANSACSRIKDSITQASKDLGSAAVALHQYVSQQATRFFDRLDSAV